MNLEYSTGAANVNGKTESNVDASWETKPGEGRRQKTEGRD
jgi:hypothetical protein